MALQANYAEVIESLELMGYQEFSNYWYLSRLVALDGTKNYEDKYGNILITENCNPIRVCLRDGGEIEINAKVLNKTSKIVSESFSRVVIGSNVILGEKVVVSSSNGNIFIGNHCKFDSYVKLRVSSGGRIHIGNYSTIQRGCHIVASFGAQVVLGEDCMVSYYVLLRAGNSHNIIDLNTLINLDDNSNRDVVIGKHVWIGMRATIMNGVTVDAGATIGANSFLIKKSYPGNCCIAGNPARIIRERTVWIRDGVVMHKDIADYSNFIFD